MKLQFKAIRFDGKEEFYQVSTFVRILYKFYIINPVGQVQLSVRFSW